MPHRTNESEAYARPDTNVNLQMDVLARSSIIRLASLPSKYTCLSHELDLNAVHKYAGGGAESHCRHCDSL